MPFHKFQHANNWLYFYYASIVLVSSDIIERTLRSLEVVTSDTTVAICEQFIAHLLCLGGIFCEPTPEDAMWETNAGNILPDPSVLTTFRCMCLRNLCPRSLFGARIILLHFFQGLTTVMLWCFQ